LTETVSYYYSNNLIEDILACSPMNLIFTVFYISDPIWLVVPLRLIRIYSVIRIPSLLEKIETNYRQWSSQLNAFKSVLFLFYLWHWSSCGWYYVNDTIEKDESFTWIDYNGINDSPLLEKYLYSVYFTMNIVTSVGYGDMFGTTDTERVATSIIIMIGDALFAVAFGLMASIA